MTVSPSTTGFWFSSDITLIHGNFFLAIVCPWLDLGLDLYSLDAHRLLVPLRGVEPFSATGPDSKLICRVCSNREKSHEILRLNWMEIKHRPWRGQTVRYIHSPTELSWPGPWISHSIEIKKEHQSPKVSIMEQTVNHLRESVQGFNMAASDWHNTPARDRQGCNNSWKVAVASEDARVLLPDFRCD